MRTYQTPGPDFRQTARLSWDRPRVPYHPSPYFVRTVIMLLSLIVLVKGIG